MTLRNSDIKHRKQEKEFLLMEVTVKSHRRLVNH